MLSLLPDFLRNGIKQGQYNYQQKQQKLGYCHFFAAFPSLLEEEYRGFSQEILWRYIQPGTIHTKIIVPSVLLGTFYITDTYKRLQLMSEDEGKDDHNLKRKATL